MSGSKRKPMRRALVTLGTVVGAILWLKLATMLVASAVGTTAWNLGDLPGSERFFAVVTTANLIEPHKAHFNVGTAMAAQDDLIEARRSLRTALKLTTDEDDCPVRLNLALVLEGLTTKAEKAADAAGAEAYRREGETVISKASADCRSGRLAPVAQRSGSGQGPADAPDAPPQPSEEPPPEEGTQVPGAADGPLAELESRMEEGQKAQAADGSPPGKGRPDPVSKPW